MAGICCVLTGIAPCRLASLSAASRQALHSLRVPTSRNEEYRYTDLAPLTRSNLSAAPAAAHVDSSFVSDLALKGAEGSTVVLVNGAFRPDLSSISGLPAGVYIGGIAQAPKEAADLIVSNWVGQGVLQQQEQCLQSAVPCTFQRLRQAQHGLSSRHRRLHWQLHCTRCS
jgi:hypothetical protein